MGNKISKGKRFSLHATFSWGKNCATRGGAEAMKSYRPIDDGMTIPAPSGGYGAVRVAPWWRHRMMIAGYAIALGFTAVAAGLALP